MILVDSNLLLRLADQASPHRPVARQAILQLNRQNERLAVVPQNLYEFWVVATRPAGKPNGLGMSPERVNLWLDYIQRRFLLLADAHAILPAWRELISTYKVTGYRAHDARFVAAMKVHHITRLLTFNAQDFQQYPITIIDPSTM